MIRLLAFCLCSILWMGSTFDKSRQPFIFEDGTRNPLRWPFSVESIWNMPIGSNAVYVHAQLERAMGMGLTIDEDYIVMTPDVPLMKINQSTAGWDRQQSRCIHNGKYLCSLPIPQSFVVSPDTWDGLTPNAGIAVLDTDGRTIRQNQPFAHCSVGADATSCFIFPEQDLYGPGHGGAHGGSHLSVLGGALRVGELTPHSGPVRHALKVNIFARRNIYYDEETGGHRWPATVADSYAAREYYKDRKNPVVKECRMGALLALPPEMNIDGMGFETEPAKILAQAFQDYGAYLVDDTAWDVYAIAVEWGPDGRFNEEFKKHWGFDMNQPKDTPWGRDMDRIFLNLHVVDNNSSSSIGGGGAPRVALAPPLAKKHR